MEQQFGEQRGLCFICESRQIPSQIHQLCCGKAVCDSCVRTRSRNMGIVCPKCNRLHDPQRLLALCSMMRRAQNTFIKQDQLQQQQQEISQQQNQINTSSSNNNQEMIALLRSQQQNEQQIQMVDSGQQQAIDTNNHNHSQNAQQQSQQQQQGNMNNGMETEVRTIDSSNMQAQQQQQLNQQQFPGAALKKSKSWRRLTPSMNAASTSPLRGDGFRSEKKYHGRAAGTSRLKQGYLSQSTRLKDVGDDVYDNDNMMFFSQRLNNSQAQQIHAPFQHQGYQSQQAQQQLQQHSLQQYQQQQYSQQQWPQSLSQQHQQVLLQQQNQLLNQQILSQQQQQQQLQYQLPPNSNTISPHPFQTSYQPLLFQSQFQQQQQQQQLQQQQAINLLRNNNNNTNFDAYTNDGFFVNNNPLQSQQLLLNMRNKSFFSTPALPAIIDVGHPYQSSYPGLVPVQQQQIQSSFSQPQQVVYYLLPEQQQPSIPQSSFGMSQQTIFNNDLQQQQQLSNNNMFYNYLNQSSNRLNSQQQLDINRNIFSPKYNQQQMSQSQQQQQPQQPFMISQSSQYQQDTRSNDISLLGSETSRTSQRSTAMNSSQGNWQLNLSQKADFEGIKARHQILQREGGGDGSPVWPSNNTQENQWDGQLQQYQQEQSISFNMQEKQEKLFEDLKKQIQQMNMVKREEQQQHIAGGQAGGIQQIDETQLDGQEGRNIIQDQGLAQELQLQQQQQQQQFLPEDKTIQINNNDMLESQLTVLMGNIEL